MVEEHVQRRLAAILAADVVGYSRLMGEDEEATLATLNTFRSVIDELIQTHDGRVFGAAGDSVIAEFASPVEAVRCAIAIQEELTVRNTELVEDRRMHFRIGINVGDVMVEGDNLFGDGVNIAARLEGLAESQGICISGSAFEQVRDKLDVGFEDLGEQQVKNIDRPIRAYRVLTDPTAAGKFATAPAKQITHWKVTAIAAAFVVIIVAGGLAWWNLGIEPAREDRMVYPLPAKPSIAVLPFTNMSNEKEQEYFADGIAEDIITDLAKVSGLFVVARNSSFTYKGRAVKVKEIAQDLGVRYVLKGSVRRSGDRIRINVQLIDALKGNHLWAERYDRELVDVFDVQDEVAESVVSALAVEFKTGEQSRLRRKYELSPDNYDLFLNARAILSTNSSDSRRLLNARRLFERIVESAPQFPGGYAGLSNTFSLAVLHGTSRSPVEEAKVALDWARKAWEIDEQLGISQFAMANALLISGKPDDAVQILEKMLETEPSNADAHARLGLFRMFAGRANEAVKPIKTAIRLNPGLGSSYLSYLGQVNFALGKYAAASTAFEDNDTRGDLNDDATLASWAASYNELGQTTESEALVERLEHEYPDFHLKSFRFLQFFKRPNDRQRLFEILKKANLSVDRPWTR